MLARVMERLHVPSASSGGYSCQELALEPVALAHKRIEFLLISDRVFQSPPRVNVRFASEVHEASRRLSNRSRRS